MEPSTEAPESRLPLLDGADIINLVNGQKPPYGQVSYTTHSLDNIRTRRIPVIGQLIGGKQPHYEVRLAEHLLYYWKKNGSGCIVLGHVQAASVTPDGSLVLNRAGGKPTILPKLCRPEPLAALINGLLDGSIAPDHPNRPSCRTCVHLTDLRPNTRPRPTKQLLPEQPQRRLVRRAQSSRLYEDSAVAGAGAATFKGRIMKGPDEQTEASRPEPVTGETNNTRWSEPLYEILDPGIREVVGVLHEGGIDTHESCQGGPGHSYTVPTVIARRLQKEPSQIRRLLEEHGYEIKATREGKYDHINPYWVINVEPWPELSKAEAKRTTGAVDD